MKAADLRDEVQGIVEMWLNRVDEGRIKQHTDGLWHLDPDDRGADLQAQPQTFRITIGVQEVS